MSERMAADKKKKPAAAPAAKPKKPTTLPAYLKLSPWLPETVCLRSAQHQWVNIREETERKARDGSKKDEIERRERACEYVHSIIQYGGDLWRDELERNPHFSVVPQTHVWLAPQCAAALRRTCRQCAHAKDVDVYVDEFLRDMPAAYESMRTILKQSAALVPRLQSACRGFITRKRIRRWLIGKFEQRKKGNNKYYVDLDVEREQAKQPKKKKTTFSVSRKQATHPLSWKKPPLMLKREPNLGSPRSMQRRLSTEATKQKYRLQKDTLTRKANALIRRTRDERAEALYEVACLGHALDAAHRYLGRQLSEARFRKEPPPARSEAVAPLTQEQQRLKRAEYQIIFNRYDEDRGGTVDAEELDTIFRDMGRILRKEDIETLIFEHAVTDAERDEVYFDEFCGMLEALDGQVEKDKKEAEEKSIREALRHHVCCRVAFPGAAPDDSASGDAARLLDEALLARLDPEESEEEEPTPLVAWDAPISTCFLEKTTDDKVAEKKRREEKRRAREALKLKREMNRGGRDTLGQRRLKNDRLAVHRECCQEAASWHASSDALRLLIKSEKVENSMKDSLTLYQQDQAWPLRSCFPLPMRVEKVVGCLQLAQRYVGFVDREGQLVALSQHDADVQHGSEWLGALERTVTDVVNIFAEARGAWRRVYEQYDRRTCVERAREQSGKTNGVGEAILKIGNINETAKKKENRYRAAFIKYNDEGRVDAEALKDVFKDLQLEVVDSAEDMIEHYANGAEGVDHAQFGEILELLEADEGYKLRKVFDKYIMRLWAIKGGDRSTTLDAPALALLFGDLRVEHYFTETKIQELVEAHGLQGVVDFQQFQALVDSLKGLQVKRNAVRVTCRSFTKEDALSTKRFGTDTLFPPNIADLPLHIKARHAFDRHDRDKSDKLDVKELYAVFTELELPYDMAALEALMIEFGNNGEVNFDACLAMLESLPPTYEVPSVFCRIRDYADEVCEQLGEIRGNRDRFLPPAPDVLVVDFFLDTIGDQLKREVKLQQAGWPVGRSPKTTPYVVSVVPLQFKHSKEKLPLPHLGLFTMSKDDRKAMGGLRVPPQRKSRYTPAGQPDKTPVVEKEDPSEYGWKGADAHGVVRLKKKIGDGRVFEFRAREGLRTGKALTEALDPGPWKGHFL